MEVFYVSGHVYNSSPRENWHYFQKQIFHHKLNLQNEFILITNRFKAD